MLRPVITDAEIHVVIGHVAGKLWTRLEQKGPAKFISRHEAFGVLMEEVHELEHAVEEAGLEGFHDELMDIAVAAILGLVSLGSFEW